MTHTTSEQAIPSDLLLRLRNIAPKRALFYSEALTVAKLQALRLRSLLGMTGPHADLSWILQVPNMQVKGLPAYEIRELTKGDASGVTQRLKSGDYFIGINRNRSYTHRRFTLAHEIKHWLDYPYISTLYRALGHGDKEARHKQVENICNHFAAHFLVPDTLLKQAWTTGFQDVPALAGMFSVSEDTMRIRLTNEGFLDSADEVLFRRVGLLPELGTACQIAA
jgi:Zn-dependent peptidase ImmA (M78 family)